jgi:hypothetical protein
MSVEYWCDDSKWGKLKYAQEHLLECQFAYHRSEWVMP